MVNDTSIIYGIIVFFIMLGVIIPLVNEAFDSEEVSTIDVQTLIQTGGSVTLDNATHTCVSVPAGIWGIFGFTIDQCYELEEGQIVENRDVSWLSYIFSIASIFFWTFGAVFWVIDLFILLPMRLLLAWLIYRALRSGSG